MRFIGEEEGSYPCSLLGPVGIGGISVGGISVGGAPVGSICTGGSHVIFALLLSIFAPATIIPFDGLLERFLVGAVAVDVVIFTTQPAATKSSMGLFHLSASKFLASVHMEHGSSSTLQG